MEYKVGRAIVRINGQCDQANLKKATEEFLKKAEEQRRKKKKEKHNDI